MSDDNASTDEIQHKPRPLFYGTFGTGRPFGNMYVQIIANDMEDARNAMFTVFGEVWCAVYTHERYAEAIEPWNYRKLCILQRNIGGEWKAYGDRQHYEERNHY